MNGATAIDAGRRAAQRRAHWRVFAIASLATLSACGPAPGPPSNAPRAGGWYEFQGSWIAAGSRRIVSLGGDRKAGIIDLKGSMLLAGPSRPGVGFRAEAIALGDSATGVVGRAVWTDENGDQAYSEFRGTGNSTGSRIEGTFIGGTGRYADADGTYEFTWQYVLEAEDGTVQGRAVGLVGRVRFGQPPPAPTAREVKP